MRDDTPSFTAALVSFGRGVSRPEIDPDPYSTDLLIAPFRQLLRAHERLGRPATLRSLFRAASIGMVDHVSLRTSAIDRALGGAVAAGVQQVVILGAGLDMRARRLPALGQLSVFEVDHPATQRLKRRRAPMPAANERAPTYVAIDFDRERLLDVLPAAGFDPARPTAWIWEGVTMYLPREATAATLADVSELSATGSRMIVSYLLPNAMGFGPAWDRFARTAFAGVGEAIRGEFSRAEIRDLLRDANFGVLTDTNNVDWAVAAGGPSWPARIFRGERVAVAETPCAR